MHKDDLAAGDRRTRELEAEAVAFVVSCGVGLEMSTARMKSLIRIQGTAAEILDAITAGRKKEQPLVATAA